MSTLSLPFPCGEAWLMHPLTCVLVTSSHLYRKACAVQGHMKVLHPSERQPPGKHTVRPGLAIPCRRDRVKGGAGVLPSSSFAQSQEELGCHPAFPTARAPLSTTLTCGRPPEDTLDAPGSSPSRLGQLQEADSVATNKQTNKNLLYTKDQLLG